MKYSIYLLIALISLLTVLAIDEFKPGDRYYFSVSNQSGGITGGKFSYNLTDMNMTVVLQANSVTEFRNGIYYINITATGSTEPRVLQINGSYGTSGYLNLVDMIYIVSTRKTVVFEGIGPNFTNIETKVNTVNTGVQNNRTRTEGNLSTVRSELATLGTNMGNNFTKVNSNLTTIRDEQANGFDRMLVNFSSVITNQSNIKLAIDTAVIGIRTNESLLQTHMQNNFTNIETKVNTVNTGVQNNRTRTEGNLSTVRSELATAQADLDNPNQYKADVSNLATTSQLAQNTSAIINNVSNGVGNIIARGDIAWITATGFATTAQANSILTGASSNTSYLESNLSTLRTEQTNGFDRMLVNFSSVIANQSNIKSAVDIAVTGIQSNRTNLSTQITNTQIYLEGNLSTIRTDIVNLNNNLSANFSDVISDISTLSTNMNDNFTRVNSNLTTVREDILHFRNNVSSNLTNISNNIITVLNRIGTPEGNSTTIWDYIFCSNSNFNSPVCLTYRIWVNYPFRTTSGIET